VAGGEGERIGEVHEGEGVPVGVARSGTRHGALEHLDGDVRQRERDEHGETELSLTYRDEQQPRPDRRARAA
jgi:hypothetical protein